MRKLHHMWGAGLFLMLLNFSAEAQWVQTNGPAEGIVLALVSYGTKLFAGTGGGGIFLSPNNGDNWIAANTGVTDLDISALVASDTNLFAGALTEGVFRSTDSGSMWTRTGLRCGACAIYAFAVNDTYLFAGGHHGDFSAAGGVYRSSDNGTQWTQVTSGLVGTLGYTVRALVVNGCQTFAGLEESTGAFLSTNNGVRWTAVNSGLTNTNIRALLMNGTNLFAGTIGGGIFRSIDSGANWTPINSGLTNMDANAFAASGANLFVGTDNGVFLSTDSGASWTTLSTGLPVKPYVTALTVLGDNLFAATWGYGVWRLPLSATFVQKPHNTSLTQFNFKLNSPNRFNHILSLEFSLLRPEQVTAQIIDLSGHQIAALVNKHLGTGAHHVSWDTRNMALGSYILSFTAGGIKIDRKVLIVK